MTTTPIKTETARYSLPRILLSLEGLTVFISSLVMYQYVGGNWWLFGALLLAPDLVFIIYMLDKSIGIIAYNLMHNYIFPVMLGVGAILSGWQFGIVLSIIWLAHIGMDRTVGYGLKYQPGFKETHLNRA